MFLSSCKVSKWPWERRPCIRRWALQRSLKPGYVMIARLYLPNSPPYKKCRWFIVRKLEITVLYLKGAQNVLTCNEAGGSSVINKCVVNSSCLWMCRFAYGSNTQQRSERPEFDSVSRCRSNVGWPLTWPSKNRTTLHNITSGQCH